MSGDERQLPTFPAEDRCSCRMIRPHLLSMCRKHSEQLAGELDREPRVIPALRELFSKYGGAK